MGTEKLFDSSGLIERGEKGKINLLQEISCVILGADQANSEAKGQFQKGEAENSDES